MKADETDLSSWPPSLAEIAHVAGVRAALQLAGEYGGRRLYIRERVEGSPLARCVGLPAARVLLRALGPGWKLIPLGPTASNVRRHEQIARCLAEGKTVSQIVRELRCHERTVYRHKQARRAADPRSPGLFD